MQKPGLPASGVLLSSGLESPQISLSVGDNLITVEVTSANGRFALGYTINVTKHFRQDVWSY